jgi:hypothetical protein
MFVRKYPCACCKCRECKFTECEWQQYHTGSFKGHTLTAKTADREEDNDIHGDDAMQE